MTIKELKEAIKNLPDDMPIIGYNGSDNICQVSYWIETTTIFGTNIEIPALFLDIS